MPESVRESGRRVGRNTLYLLSSEVGGKLLGAAYQLLLAGYLGTRLFGEFSFALATAVILGMVADLGLTSLVSREVSRSREEPWKAVAPALLARSGLTLLLGLVALVALRGAGRPAEVVEVLAILLITQLVQGEAEILAAGHRGRERMLLPAAASLICRAGIVATGLLAMSLDARIHVFALLTTLWTLPLAALLAARLPGRIGRPGLGEAWSILRRAAPIGLGAMLWAFYFRVDLVILGFLREEEEVGLYAAAFRVVEAVLLLSAPLLAAAFPLLASRDRNDPTFRAVRDRVVGLLAVVSLPAAALFALEGGAIIEALLGPEYRACGEATLLLAPVIPLSFAAAPLLTLLVARDRERIYSRIMVVAALMNPALDILLIREWGFVGAAAATLATEVAVLLLAILTSRERGALRTSLRIHLRALPAAVALVGALLLTRHLGLPLLLRLGLAPVVYLPLAFLFRAIRRGEFRLLTETLIARE